MKALSGTLLLAAALCACTRLLPDLPAVQACVEIRLEGTRLTGVSDADEARVAHWCVFLAEGEQIVTFGTAEGSAPVTGVAVREGTYTLVALANYPTGLDLGQFHQLQELTAYTFPLEDNARNALMMAGERSAVLLDAQTGSVGISLDRLCARVSVKKVTLDFSSRPVLAAQSFRLQEMYLSNAYARTCLHLPASWSMMPYGDYLNKRGTVTSTLPLIHETLGVNLSSGSSYTTAHHFYTWPNGTPEGTDAVNRLSDSWNGHRRTRLVLRALLGGVSRYYVVDLPDIRRNRLYTIDELILRGRGSDDPEVPSEEIEVLFSTTGPDSWDGTPDYSVTENA